MAFAPFAVGQCLLLSDGPPVTMGGSGVAGTNDGPAAAGPAATLLLSLRMSVFHACLAPPQSKSSSAASAPLLWMHVAVNH